MKVPLAATEHGLLLAPRPAAELPSPLATQGHMISTPNERQRLASSKHLRAVRRTFGRNYIEKKLVLRRFNTWG